MPYQGQHHHAPARVVVMKTSRFHAKAADGFEQALSEANISIATLYGFPNPRPSPCSGKGTTRRFAPMIELVGTHFSSRGWISAGAFVRTHAISLGLMFRCRLHGGDARWTWANGCVG